jgi:hypothetical protein
MSFYSGRAGKSFAIERIFSSIEEMNQEAANTSSDWEELLVPINGFVLVTENIEEGNAAIYIKQYIDDKYQYIKVGTIASIFPEIENGYWVLGGAPTKHLAEAKSVQFRIVQEEAPADYVFVSRLTEDGIFEYGLCNLDERYIYNEALTSYERSEDGTFVTVIKAEVNGNKILDIDGAEQYYQNADGSIYFDINDDTWSFNLDLRMKFTNTWVQ